MDSARGERQRDHRPARRGQVPRFNMIRAVFTLRSGTIELNGERIDRLPPQRIHPVGLSSSFQITSIFSRSDGVREFAMRHCCEPSYRYR